MNQNKGCTKIELVGKYGGAGVKTVKLNILALKSEHLYLWLHWDYSALFNLMKSV